MKLFAAIRVIGAALAAGCMLLGATAAGAVNLLHVVYEGQVTDLYDPTGVFGPGAGVGSRYKSEYLFDLDRGTRIHAPAYDQVFGGDPWFTTSPAIWTQFTLNDVTLRWNTDNVGQQLNREGEYVSSTADGLRNGVWRIQSHIFYSPDAPYTLETPLVLTGPGAGAFDGAYSVCVYDASLGCSKQITRAYMTTDRVTVRVGSIPEPGAWALMILGFAGVGGALRRRAVALG